MDSYATLKTLGVELTAAIHLLVNHCPNAEMAKDVHQRIYQSCRRFLKTNIHQLGHIPTDNLMAESAKKAHPLIVDAPTAPATVGIQRIASCLLRAEWKTASAGVATATR